MSWDDMARTRDAARIGSKKLRDAILKSMGYKPPRPELRRPRARKPLLVNPRIIAVQRITASHYGIKQQELIDYNRERTISRPRQVAMYLAHIGGASLSEIGRHFARDHTTVLHAVRSVPDNPDLWNAAIDIQKLLTENHFSGDNYLRKSAICGKEKTTETQEEMAA